jgi:sugar O-acyltransferase (sialic acid O-acetyltransferase NeuD family)
MTAIRVPLVNANEDELRVVAVSVREGDRVDKGALLCVVESTKATFEVEAPEAGFVRQLSVRSDAQVRVGSLVCVLTPTPDEALDPGAVGETVRGTAEVRATRRARQLAEQHGIDLSTLDVSGIIKTEHVERALAGVRAAASPTGARGDRLVVLGAGGHARMVIDLLRSSRPDLHVVGLLDDGSDVPREVNGVPVLGTSERLGPLRAEGVRYAALGIGAIHDNTVRAALYRRLIDAGFVVPNLVHRSAIVEPSATMGQGNQVFAGAIVGAGASLEDNTVVNSGAIVSHDCVIESHAHITPGAILGGHVKVGTGAIVGMGVTVYVGVRIGRDAVIYNGTHVRADVGAGAVARPE